MINDMTIEYKHFLLFVDDEEAITKALRRLFRKDGYTIRTASSGMEGLKLLQEAEEPFSLIISDQRMPKMTGSEFLEKSRKIFPDAIRFLLTGYSDMDAVVDAVNKGEIHRYLTKPWNDDELRLQVRQSLQQFELVQENRRLLDLTNRQNKELTELNRDLEKKVEERTLEISQKNTELEEANIKLEKSFIGTIRLLSSLVETLNPKLGKQMKHVAQLSKEVAKKFKLDKKELEQIEMAGMIHDIGLLGLPENLWTKDEKEMNQSEFNAYSQHPLIASICLESIEQLYEVGEIILHHHEYFDGSGFPNGLKGNRIPLGSRIITAVSDYCFILHTWPKKMSQLINKTRRYLGENALQNFTVTEPDEMIEQVADKVIMLEANQKYDIEVVTTLIKKTGEARAVEKAEKQQEPKKGLPKWVEINSLKEGMILAEDLRIKDGRLLMVKYTTLNKKSIKSILDLWKHKMLDDKISIAS